MLRALLAPLLIGLLAQAQPAFRAGVSLVRVDAEVMQQGEPVEELAQADFSIADNGRPQDIVQFSHREEPLDLILLFDTSASMKPVVERVAETAKTALGDLRDDDRVAVMAFSRGNDLLLDFTSDRDAVLRTLPRVLERPFVRASQLHGGIDAAATHLLAQPATARRRAILAITDGLGSDHVGGVVERVWEADAVVAGLIVRNAGMAVLFRVVRPDTLFHGGVGGISDNTGGDAARYDDAGAGLRQMIRRLRLRYSLAYAMPDAKPGERRRIAVRLTGDAARRYPAARVRARTGYVVPDRGQTSD